MNSCPRCGSKKLHRSHTRAWEKPFKAMTLRRAYRCTDCDWRGWRIPEASEDQPLPDTATSAPTLSDPDIFTLDLDR